MQIRILNFERGDQSSYYLISDTSQPVYVVETGFHKTPSGHCYGPAVREYYLLHLIEKGKGTMERNGVVTNLKEGDAFLIRPGEVTTYRADIDEPWEYCWIAFNGAYAEKLISETTALLCMPYRKSGLMALKNALTQIKTSATIDSLTVWLLLLNVLESIKTGETLSKPNDCDNVMSFALRYLEENYHKDIDVSSLAEQAGFSRSYFSTLFLKRTGEKPYKYLTKIRLNRAKAYLENSSLSMEEIAYSVGFSSLQRFSEMFKKEFGLSPMQYKKSLTRF